MSLVCRACNGTQKVWSHARGGFEACECAIFPVAPSASNSRIGVRARASTSVPQVSNEEALAPAAPAEAHASDAEKQAYKDGYRRGYFECREDMKKATREKL